MTVISSVQAAGKTTVTLGFTSGTDANGSLLDANYRLQINGATLGIDANGSGTTDGIRTIDFHRLFGDTDGDMDVDGLDFQRLYSAFFGDAALINAFDRDNDMDLADEINAFFGQVGTSLDPFGG